MRILLWHVHGSWTTSFVEGRHEYVLPVTPDRGPDGLGRARTWNWPSSVVEVPPDRLRDEPVDVVLLQRPHEVSLAEQWLGRRPGRDVAAVYVEHNTPHGDVPETRHPLADQNRIPVAHVTGFNELMWDCGDAPTLVVDHGIVDPGERYTGELARAAVVVNEPVRRGRSVGTDLLPALLAAAPTDVFGMQVGRLRDDSRLEDAVRSGRLGLHEDLTQEQLHTELARRRVYVHTSRWTSLGLSLLEAQHLGMPAVALAATEAHLAVRPSTGVLVSRADQLGPAVRRFVANPALARRAGSAGRRHVLRRYGLTRFLRDWDDLLEALTG